MKRVLIVLLAAVISVSAAGCSAAKSSGSNPAQQTGTIAQQTSETTVTKAEETTIAEASAGIKPGSFVQNTNYKFSFEKAKIFDEISSGEYFTNTPKDGKKYLVLFFDVENVSSKDQYVNYLYIKGYEDGYDINLSMLLGDVDGYSALTGDLAAGKKMRGYLAYEVNENWKEFELTYKAIGDKDSYDFSVTPNDLSK